MIIPPKLALYHFFQVFKLPEKNDIGPVLEELSLMGFEIIQIIEAQKKEAYVIARKI